MGSWGIEALKSDNGLDLIDFIKDMNTADLNLSRIIDGLKGYLLAGENGGTDYLYDNTAIALAELYFMFRDRGRINLSDDMNDNPLINIKSFSADKMALGFILKYLLDVKNEVSAEDGTREIVQIRRSSDSWDEWNAHLDDLIERLKEELVSAD